MTAPTVHVGEHSRVVVDSDRSGDPGGLVALAHHLLSPSNRVVAVTSSFLNPAFPGPAQGPLTNVATALRDPPTSPAASRWCGSAEPWTTGRGSTTAPPTR